MNAIRAQTQAIVDAGLRETGDIAPANRSLVNQYVTGAGDLANIFTLGVAGNLPESFLGSYEMTVSVQNVDEDGVATVTYTIHNTTTIESYVRNPFAQNTQLEPMYSDLQLQQAAGKYLDTEQTIVWTEQLIPAGP